MNGLNRRPIFDAVKLIRQKGFTLEEVKILDAGIDKAFSQAPEAPSSAPKAPSSPPTSQRRVTPKGIALIHSFEQCKLEAYPDPGSKDGHPWTIGWGSTGPGIAKGVRWTQEQCDARFEQDINQFAAGIEKLLGGSPATPHQFDALVSLAYNIGLNALRNSTVLRKHKAGDYLGAARAFLMWNKNDGKVMRGLTRRRLAESDLYDDPA